MACDTCALEDKQAEVLGLLAFATKELEDKAPCIAAILAGVALKFKHGDLAWLHQAATVMSIAGLSAVDKLKDPAFQILTGANIATD